MDFSVDPLSLRSGGRSIEGSGAAAGADLRRMHGETANGAYAAWGTDLGPAAAYDELARLTGEALDLIGAALVKSGAGTQRMAEAFEQADAAARDGFHSIDAGWPA
jgi:hypothetical protein